jgi:hypothetical protein
MVLSPKTIDPSCETQPKAQVNGRNDMDTKNYARMRARRLLVGFAVVAAAVAFPAVAGAEAVWDIGEYDSCTRTLGGRPGSESDPIAQEIENQKWCCYKSGGVWTDKQGCVAPPAEGAGSAVPPGGPKVDLPTLSVRPPIEAPAKAPVGGLERREVGPVAG